MTNSIPELCEYEGCRRLRGHSLQHDLYPTEAWGFMADKDRNKLAKAGFATPRGGAKGAYQNHVIRSSKVIIPYERINDIELSLYKNGWVVRLLPEQYFENAGTPKASFIQADAPIRVGNNAFVLYRTHEAFERFPPEAGWKVRYLMHNGGKVTKRSAEVEDHGHYVLRIPRRGAKAKRVEGPPQGIFAPEYADEETNYLSKCVLAWLIVRTATSPYTLTQAMHIRAILKEMELDNEDTYERQGIIRRGATSCPLCMRFLRYDELHDTVSFSGQEGVVNAAEQVDGATRSTVVNLFHLMPLLYHQLTHIPGNIGWGHAICNTRLGQRPCYSLAQMVDMNRKIGIIDDEGIVETFGWISSDWLMIRSPNGAVWMQLNGDLSEGPPPEQGAFDSIDAANSPDSVIADSGPSSAEEGDG